MQKFKDGPYFQEFLNLWSKDRFSEFNSQVWSFVQKQGKGFKQNMSQEVVKYKGLYFTSKAIRAGASHGLPYSTLMLLGEKLSHPAYKEDIQNIIETNVIKYNGEYFKLDDLDQQNKVKKALKTYQFQECQEIKKAA